MLDGVRRVRLMLHTAGLPPVRSSARTERALPPADGQAIALQAFRFGRLPTQVAVPSRHLLIEALRRPVESAQFTSWAFTRRAVDSGLLPSMGSVGDCYDNAMMESFWSRVQVELLDRQRWSTRIELASAIFEYLEIFHRRQTEDVLMLA